ncbi:Asp-tRNA(Asn)/Glu-tRNA(Gln) amidotransferase subunit GatC [Candidatus Parcubacteria bacterium]|nr:Asp-tRNA(Asn)/Glu-tRNA(Gln) amidotransferase subunit GatC [Candidatus Parcubacteria bacterium]
MKLNKKDIQHIANLARLELTEKELAKYGSQISNILKYIDQLQEVDTANVEPTAQVTGLTNVFQEDKVCVWDKDEVKAALKQAPEFEGGQVKVKRVLD